MTLSNHLKADLLLVWVTMLAAAGWIFSKETLTEMSPIFFIGLRFLLAGIVVGLIGHQALRQLNRRGLLRTAAVGLVFSVALVCWILGLAYSQHLGVGAFLTSLGVVLVPLVARAFGDRVGGGVWAAIPIAIAGLGCLSLDSEFHLGRGEIGFLLAALIFAIYFTLNSRAAAKTSPIALTSVQLTVVGLVALPLGWMVEGAPNVESSSIWLWFAASVLIATAWRFFLQTKAQSMAPPSHTAIIMVLEPVWTALLAAAWYGETMSSLQFAGCGLILLALLTTRYSALRHWIKSLRQTGSRI